MKKFQVFTRCNNDVLYEMMRMFIPPGVECIKCDDFPGWENATRYLHHIIDTADDWAINIDMDCFVFNWPKIVRTIHYMSLYDFTHFGIHDGGQVPHRNFRWQTMNPCFNIFDAATIRDMKDDDKLINGFTNEKTWQTIDATKYRNEWDNDRRPIYLKDYVLADEDEPFAGFFYWLYDNGKPLFDVNVEMFKDDVSIITDTYIHTWYGRDFDYSKKQKERIKAAFNEALKLWQVRTGE